ncbi:MAG: ThuA domain-containing protein [Planctomycetota bacterium]
MVVTGGHDYDKDEFAEMFQSMNGVTASFVSTEEMEAMDSQDIATNYDTLVHLDMVREKVDSQVKDHYVELSEAGVGMVFLHFTLASRPYWDGYHELVGGKFYLPNVEKDASLHSTYTTDLTVQIQVLNQAHPVTKGLDDFAMTDAFYGNIAIAPGVQPLLAASNDQTSNCVAWTHTFGRSQVVYLMPGFRKGAYENASYRRLLANALRYVAPRR